VGYLGDFFQLLKIKVSFSSRNINQLLIKEYYTNAKAKKELSLPETPIEEAIESALKWFYPKFIIKNVVLMSLKTILPPEWAKQDFIQLTFPHEGTDWAYLLDEVNACFVEIARAILRFQNLLVVCHDKIKLSICSKVQKVKISFLLNCLPMTPGHVITVVLLSLKAIKK